MTKFIVNIPKHIKTKHLNKNLQLKPFYSSKKLEYFVLYLEKSWVSWYNITKVYKL